MINQSHASSVEWIRRIVMAFFIVIAVAGCYLMLGYGDPPPAQVASKARKCATSLGLGMVQDAEMYCTDAIALVEQHHLNGIESAEAYGQLAVLRIYKHQYPEAAEACRRAIPIWGRWHGDIISWQGKIALDGIAKCRGVITDVSRKVDTIS